MVNSLLEQNDPLEQLALYRKLKDQSQSNNDFDDLVNKLNLDYNMLKNNCPAIFSTNVGKDSGLDDILDYGSSVNTKAQYNRNKYFTSNEIQVLNHSMGDLLAKYFPLFFRKS